jgi:serine/threonine protein kinase
MTTALRYLHEECFILHCDLHVRNWFLNAEGALILGDFGSSK